MGSLRRLASCFWGRRDVRAVLDRGHHGEGQHDERDMTTPAMPGTCFIVVEAQPTESWVPIALEIRTK